MKKHRTGLALMLALCITAGAQTSADDVEAVKTAVANFYSAANYQDLETILGYMAPGGYTAFVENASELVRVDEQRWRDSFKTDYVQNFEAIGLEVKVHKDAALVTGSRCTSFRVAMWSAEGVGAAGACEGREGGSVVTGTGWCFIGLPRSLPRSSRAGEAAGVESRDVG